MANFIQSVDDRTRLAGTNRLEVLLFSLDKDIQHVPDTGITILYADDSAVARDQILRTLQHMGIKRIGTSNGADAYVPKCEPAELASKLREFFHLECA